MVERHQDRGSVLEQLKRAIFQGNVRRPFQIKFIKHGIPSVFHASYSS